MKQTVSPAVLAAVIVVVVVLIGFAGYKMFLAGPSTSGPKPAVAEDNRKFREQYQNYGQQRPTMPGNMRGPGGPGGPSSAGR